MLVKTAVSIDHKHHKKTLPIEHHTSTFQNEVEIRYIHLTLYEKVDVLTPYCGGDYYMWIGAVKIVAE